MRKIAKKDEVCQHSLTLRSPKTPAKCRIVSIYRWSSIYREGDFGMLEKMVLAVTLTLSLALLGAQTGNPTTSVALRQHLHETSHQIVSLLLPKK